MAKIIPHPTRNRALYELRQLYSDLEKDHGLDNRRSNMGRRWTDRRCDVRESDKLTPGEMRQENRWMFWWLVGIILLALSFSAYACGDFTEPETVEIHTVRGFSRANS